MVSYETIARLLTISCLTGFAGDAALQYLSTFMGGETGWGLKEYFRQHGKAESLFIAGGMMTLFYIIYFVILGLPLNWFYLAIYGVVLDWIFRAAMLFPSLKGYYNHLNYFWSGFWGGTPMLMPYGIMLMIDKLSMK
jgi:hypothetical protein